MTEKKSNRVAALFDLTGRVAIVTGGAGLLGYHHGAILAAAGANVVLLDIAIANPQKRAGQITQEYGHECLGLIADITSEASLEQAREQIVSKFGRIDILINNAANNPKVENLQGQTWSRLECFPLEVWDADIRVGLTGAFLCSRIFGAEMMDALTVPANAVMRDERGVTQVYVYEAARKRVYARRVGCSTRAARSIFSSSWVVRP